MGLLGLINSGVPPPSSPAFFYFLLRWRSAEPATDLYAFVVFLLLKALLAFLATLLDVLAIVKSFCCEGRNRTYDLKVMSLPSYLCSTSRYINKDKK